MPNSSFARARRVLVSHMEDEGDQENEKEDERESGKQRVERRVVENQATHNMSAWGWDEVKCATHQTWANVDVTLKCVLWNTRKCYVWGVLFTQCLLQNQSLQTVPICIVWQCFPHDNVVCSHKCDECEWSNEIIVCHMLWSILWSIVQVCSLTMEYRVFHYVPRINISEQFGRILLTILPRISILLLWNDGHQCMELIICRVVESSCLPTHNIVLHITWHDLPCHKTRKRYSDFPSMVIFQLPVGCSRLLSAVSDLTTKFFQKITCQSVTLSSLVRKRLQQAAVLGDAAHSTSSEGIDFDEFMSSTSGHSTATMMYWMKKTTNAISETGRKEPVQVALLQTHQENGAYLLMLHGNLIGVSSVHFCQMCSARYTVFFYLSNSSVDGR